MHLRIAVGVAVAILSVPLVLTSLFVFGGPALQSELARLPFLGPAATYFVQSITVEQLRAGYHAPTDPLTGTVPYSTKPGRIRILIMPGHEPDYGGTEFRGIFERDVVVDLAEDLAELLAQNPRYEVIIARTTTAWHPTLVEYFASRWGDIVAFSKTQKQITNAHYESGALVEKSDKIHHNNAREDIALRLYGINKWAAENNIALTLHLHINDYPRRQDRVGEYDGFSIYVPDYQYSTSQASKAVGEALASRLRAFRPESSLPKEGGGVVETQELIAAGSNNTLDNAGMLIEYGYIYEPQFLDASTRALALRDYAYQTYLGLQDFFGDPVQGTYGSGALPFVWSDRPLAGKTTPDIYALQSALRYLGHYPPAGKSLTECPISGYFGACTGLSLKAFQRAHNLAPSGVFDQKTKVALTQVFIP